MLRRLSRVKNIVRLTDKIRFCIATFLSYLNDIFHSKVLMGIMNRLAFGTLIKYKDCLFLIPDYGSLRFFDPLHEGWVWRYINVPADSIIIDVGAHVGKYTVVLAREVAPKGIIISIEPDPVNFRFLRLNCVINDVIRRVRLYNVAAYDKDYKLLTLYESYDGGLHSLLLKRYTRRTVLVKTRTIDSIVSELGLDRVDLIKIDVEGAESKVLKGSIMTLLKFKPDIIMEVQRFNSRYILSKLIELGYKICLAEVSTDMFYIVARHKGKLK